jgi:hypothetical protein
MLWRAFEWLSHDRLRWIRSLLRIVVIWFQCSGELLSGCLYVPVSLPEQSCTKHQLVSMLWRAFEWLSPTDCFSLTVPFGVYRGKFQCSGELLSGCLRGPRREPIPRGRQVSMLWRAFEWLSQGLGYVSVMPVGEARIIMFQCSGELLSGCLRVWGVLLEVPAPRFNALASF